MADAADLSLSVQVYAWHGTWKHVLTVLLPGIVVSGLLFRVDWECAGLAWSLMR